MSLTTLETVAGWLRDIYYTVSGLGSVSMKTQIKNSDGIVINPATAEKQDTGNTTLSNIETNQTDGTAKVQITDGESAGEVAAIVTGPFTGEKGLRVYGGPTDPISDIPVSLEFDHHQVHEGESHGYSNLTASLASGSNKDFRINVPAALDTVGEAPHMVFEVITTLEAEAYIYEGMTYDAGNGGTERTSHNRNRIKSAVAPVTKVYEDPTPATTGTNLWIGLTGSANRAGSQSRSLTEWVLKPGDYLFRVTSRAAGCKILIRFEWYEDLGV